MSVKLTSRIPEIQAALPIRVGAAVREGTEAIAADARAHAPDRPPMGEGLVETIQARAEDDDYGIWAAWYWHFNEFGTTRAPARPFMIPAVERGKENIEGLVMAALRGL